MTVSYPLPRPLRTQEVTDQHTDAWVAAIEDHQARVLSLEGRGIIGKSGPVTAPQGNITTADVDLTGMTAKVTVDGTRQISVSAYALIASTVAGDRYVVKLWDETGQIIQQWIETIMVSGVTSGTAKPETPTFTPTAGQHTYKATLARASGTGTLTLRADPTSPCWLKVRDEGPA